MWRIRTHLCLLGFPPLLISLRSSADMSPVRSVEFMYGLHNLHLSTSSMIERGGYSPRSHPTSASFLHSLHFPPLLFSCTSQLQISFPLHAPILPPLATRFTGFHSFLAWGRNGASRQKRGKVEGKTHRHSLATYVLTQAWPGKGRAMVETREQ